MNRDPIVDEVRQIRRRLLDECGGDIGKYMEEAQKLAQQYPERLVARDSAGAKKLLESSGAEK